MELIKCAKLPTDYGETKGPVNDRPRIAVMGIGNLLLKDDGIGIHVVNRLSSLIDPADVEIIDGGTTPDIFSLINQNIERLIIVDAANGKDKPGTIYRLNMSDVESNQALPISLHDMGLSDNLKLLSMLNPQVKSVTIIGIQPADIDYGLEPPREFQANREYIFSSHIYNYRGRSQI